MSYKMFQKVNNLLTFSGFNDLFLSYSNASLTFVVEYVAERDFFRNFVAKLHSVARPPTERRSRCPFRFAHLY